MSPIKKPEPEIRRQPVISTVIKRKDYLEKLIQYMSDCLHKMPPGKLKINCDANRIQYYHRQSSDDYNGIYIPVSRLDLAKALAQKDYDERVIKAA